MPSVDPPAALRQCVLAVSVLADLDLVPEERGVVVLVEQSSQWSVVSWQEIAETLGEHDPLSSAGRRRVTTALLLRRFALQHGRTAPQRLHQAARALALPPGHALHPGPDWVLQRLAGGALDLGVGLLGLADHVDDVQPLAPLSARTLGLRPADWWPDLVDHVERMGALTARRIHRDGRPVLRPIGGCDALTLLASPTLRATLAGGDGSGMRAVATPTRRHGWFDLARIDPAYVSVAWSATTAPDRGLPTPLLVTRDDVVAPPEGRPAPG